MQRGVLTRELTRILAAQPGQHKRQLLAGLRQQGFGDLTTTDINSVLYRHRTSFVSDGGTPPLWSLASGRTNPDLDHTNGDEPRLYKPSALYRGATPRAWQLEALAAWHARGRTGVIEAVTGTGKTTTGVLAAAAAVEAGERVLVLVPSTDLLDQWFEVLRRDIPGVRVGRFGAGHRDGLEHCSVLIATVQSASRYYMSPPRTSALLIADEVHRYGAPDFAKALESGFAARMGLTATYARDDDGIATHLDPYFGGVVAGCDYERGLADGILARFRIAFVGVDFTPAERLRHDEWDEQARAARHKLILEHGCPAEPFGEYMAEVNLLSEGGNGNPRATSDARRYLNAFSKRRQLLADCERKYAALGRLTPVLATAERALVFTETVESACRSAETLRERGLAAQDFTSDLAKRARHERLDRFKRGEIRVLAAPRVLDEGIDVPQADVGVILAATRSKRQMIQRMGRIIRPKADGRLATFLVLYVTDTAEDPAQGAHEAFLEQLTEVAEAARDFRRGESAATVLKWLSAGA